MKTPKWSLTDTFIYTALALIIIAYGFSQPLISIDDGHPYDGNSYFEVANQFAANQAIRTESPFVNRIGLPFVVGKLFPNNILFGFKVINLFFGALTLVILFRYLSLRINKKTIVQFLLFLYIINPASPFRQIHYFPAITEPPALFFMLLILYLNKTISSLNIKSCLLFSTLGFVGVFFREIVLCAILVFSISHTVRFENRRLIFFSLPQIIFAFLPILFSIAGILLIHGLVEGIGAYTYGKQIPATLTYLWETPLAFPLAWLVSFGPMIIIVMLNLNSQTLEFLRKNQAEVIFALGIMVLALIAGYHTDKFTYWTYPVVLLLFGYFLENNPLMKSRNSVRVLFLLPFLLVQLLAFRVFSTIPDDSFGALANPGPTPFILFAPYGDTTNIAHVYAAYMNNDARMLIATQYFLFTIYLTFIMFFTRKSSD